MKKIYLLVIGVLSIGVVNAQYTKAHNNKHVVTKNDIVPLNTTPNNTIQSKTTTFWENDFSNPDEWAFNDNAGSGDNWVIGTDIPSGDFAIAPIESTTASNGYALYDSDLMCSGNQNADVYIANPIDLSDEGAVQIKFESYYRNFQGSAYVIASTDGQNWTEFEVHGSLAVNAASSNPEIVQVNLTSVLANSPTAYIGFRYVGGCDYAWMVDDVSLEGVDDFDLRYEGISWGTTGNWQERLTYYQVPVGQIQPIDFTGIASNIGGQTQNDVVFKVEIPQAEFESESNEHTLTPGQTDSIHTNTPFTPSSGIFTLNANVSSSAEDANPNNNGEMGIADLSVTSRTYSRDAGTIMGGYLNTDDNDQALPFQAGVVYDIFENQDLVAIDITVSPNAEPESSLFAVLYDATTGDFEFVDESLIYTITPEDLGETVRLELSQGNHTLNAEGTYLVCAGTFDGPNRGFIVGSSRSVPAQTAFYQDENQDWFFLGNAPMVRMVLFNDDEEELDFNLSSTEVCLEEVVTISDASMGTDTWNWDFGVDADPATATGQGPHEVFYTSGGTKTITLTGAEGEITKTLNVDGGCVASIDANQEYGFNLFPNPSNGTFVVTSANSSIKSARVVDATGRLIQTVNPINPSKELEISLEGQNNGIYLVEILSTSNERSVLRLVVRD